MRWKISNFWTTKTGDIVAISEMETSHIINAMKVIERNNFEMTITSGSLQCNSHDEMWFDEETYCVKDAYERMKLELRLRKLEVENE